jgi:hypothetical protein
MTATTASPPSPPPVFDHATIDRFVARCAAGFDDDSLVSLLLAKHRGPEADLQRVTLRPVVLRGERQVSMVYRYTTRDLTKNLAAPAALRWLRDALGPLFRNAHLHLRGETVELSISQRGVCTLRSTPVAAAATTGAHADAQRADTVAAHDREKQRTVEVTRPFLTALGVTTAQHTVVPAMSRKWKQINKFVEVFAGALRASELPCGARSIERQEMANLASEPRPLRVVDFGSGKGYLTFAVHDHLLQQAGVQADVVGVELRADMVQLGNAVVDRLTLNGLRFEVGDVRHYTSDRIDVVIALHACDTATDHAIHLGVRAGAAVILCSPCCHQQLRPQLLSPHPLRPILQHGVHLGQQAEMLTDGLRAMLLEACGYDTQVFEFVALEHTQKNKMILAVRRQAGAATTEHNASTVKQQITDIKSFYGIRDQCLETLLRADGLLGAFVPADTPADTPTSEPTNTPAATPAGPPSRDQSHALIGR